MSTVTKTSAATEGGHWYRRAEAGEVEQIDMVRGANGKERKPTLRDAKKAGDWMPGVTTIVRQAAAEGLVRWQINEAVRAAVELGGPRIRVEDGVIFPEEWRQFLKVVQQKAGEVAAEAREVGSAAHAMFHLGIVDPDQRRRASVETPQAEQADRMAKAIERTLREFIEDWDTRVDCINEHHQRRDEQGRVIDPLSRIPYEDQMPDWWQALDQPERELSYFGGDAMIHGGCGKSDWRSEDAVCHPLGFATKADLWTPNGCGWLFDFKGKKDADELTVKTYEDHHIQLAATREAIRHTHGVDIPASNCRIIYFSRREQYGQFKAKVADACPAQIEQGWQMFQGLLQYHQAKTNHNPGWAK